MIKAEVKEVNHDLKVEIDIEGDVREILTQTTILIHEIALGMEENESGSGRAFLKGLQIWMHMGLLLMERQEDMTEWHCPQGQDGEPGVPEEKEDTGG